MLNIDAIFFENFQFMGESMDAGTTNIDQLYASFDK
jgi:hypothetical protein